MELIGGKVRAVHVGERMRRILVMSGVTRVIEVKRRRRGSRFWTGSGQKGEWDDARKDENRREDAVEYDDAGI